MSKQRWQAPVHPAAERASKAKTGVIANVRGAYEDGHRDGYGRALTDLEREIYSGEDPLTTISAMLNLAEARRA